MSDKINISITPLDSGFILEYNEKQHGISNYEEMCTYLKSLLEDTEKKKKPS